MRSNRRTHRTAAIKHTLALALAAIFATAAPAQGVDSDPTVEPLPYSHFSNVSATQLWDMFDSLGYWEIPLDPPGGYYDGVDTTSAEAFRASLHQLIDDHTVYPYSDSSRPWQSWHRVDTWDIVLLADAHPENPDRVLDLYLNGTFDRQFAGTNANPRYDREHSWPKSLGFKSNSTSNPPTLTATTSTPPITATTLPGATRRTARHLQRQRPEGRRLRTWGAEVA